MAFAAVCVLENNSAGQNNRVGADYPGCAGRGKRLRLGVDNVTSRSRPGRSGKSAPCPGSYQLAHMLAIGGSQPKERLRGAEAPHRLRHQGDGAAIRRPRWGDVRFIVKTADDARAAILGGGDSEE